MERQLYIVNVEAAVVRDGRYLMIVRGEGESHAPGTLSMPGGKVEGTEASESILEETARREVREEVGLEVHDEVEYVQSSLFTADGVSVVDIVFLCRYKSGQPQAGDPGEVAEMRWMTAQEVLNDPEAPPWTRRSIELVERRRVELGW